MGRCVSEGVVGGEGDGGEDAEGTYAWTCVGEDGVRGNVTGWACTLPLEPDTMGSVGRTSFAVGWRAVVVAVVWLLVLVRSFSSSSSSSSSRLLMASSLASIQSMTFPIVISFPSIVLREPELVEVLAVPPTETPC